MVLLSRLGGSDMGVAYALCLTELSLAPFVPSNTARGGGIVAPIVESLGAIVPDQASYFVLVANHANLITAATFLTGMSGNVLAMAAAKKTFPEYPDSWLVWFQGSAVPGLVSLLSLPWLIAVLVPVHDPEVAVPSRRRRSEIEVWTPPSPPRSQQGHLEEELSNAIDASSDADHSIQGSSVVEMAKRELTRMGPMKAREKRYALSGI